MSVLVPTAYMEEADQFDRLHAMNDGRLIGSGSADELRAQTGTDTLEDAFTTLAPQGQRSEKVKLEIPAREKQNGKVAIKAENLTRCFGDFTAVYDVSFEIGRGEIFGFLGSNGSGKTTTMKMRRAAYQAFLADTLLHVYERGCLHQRARGGPACTGNPVDRVVHSGVFDPCTPAAAQTGPLVMPRMPGNMLRLTRKKVLSVLRDWMLMALVV